MGLETSKKQYLFRQLFEKESSTYTYLLGDPETGEGVIIDPVLDMIDRDLRECQELGLKLKYVLDTHVHADHITAAGEIRRRQGVQTVLGKGAGVDCADKAIQDGEELTIGSVVIRAIATPGHTDSCMSFYVDGAVFTGDALLIRGTGRTDFQNGSSKRLYESITKKLFRLPDDTFVYPAHDYKGQTVSTIAEEKKLNPRVGEGVTEGEFIETMANLKLEGPKKMHEAIPANLQCGNRDSGREA